MKVRIKLMGMLKDRAPAGDGLELEDGATISDALMKLAVASETIQAVTLNGSLERDKGRALVDGDELVILPPVGGG